MIDKLDFMVRFWQLRARHDAIGAPLSATERVELLGLLRLISTDHPLPEPGPPPRVDSPLPVQITALGGFVAGELRSVCANGIVIACTSPLRPGTDTIVRHLDAIAGVEYSLPCRVEWAFHGRPSATALRVDGIPARSSIVFSAPFTWRSSLALSEPRWVPCV